MSIKKRFIAGAVCPRCGKMDTLVVFNQNGQTQRECVACDFRELQLDDMASVQAGADMPTRVNKSASEDAPKKEEVQEVTIRFYPNTKMN